MLGSWKILRKEKKYIKQNDFLIIGFNMKNKKIIIKIR